MTRDQSSKSSRICSSNKSTDCTSRICRIRTARSALLSARWICLIFGALFFAGCAAAPGAPAAGTHPALGGSTPAGAAEVVKPAPVPPWQLWPEQDFANPELQAGDRFAEQGDLEAAAASYKDAIGRAAEPHVAQSAILRLCSTLLKQGKSQQALEEMSLFLKNRGQGPQDADAQLSLIAAYAYLHKRDYDQALAWFGSAYRKSGSQVIVASRAQAETRNLIRSIPAESFAAYAEKWAVDDFSGKMFFAERMRRSQGGTAALLETEDWFRAETYATAHPASTREQDLIQPAAGSSEVITAGGSAGAVGALATGEVKIGVILPLSGRFADHAAQVRRGIELAAAAVPGQTVRLVFEDSQANPAVAERAYDRLVLEERVSLVLGPLLVKTTEYVAERSKALGVPIITFTKREGVPALGTTVFRLGATSQGQVQELLDYAANELKLTSASIIYPDNDSGREFAAIFRREAARFRVAIIEQAPYRHGDQASIDSAVSRVGQAPAQALFLPDNLEQSFAVLERIAANEALKQVVLLGPAQWNDPIAIRGYGQLIDGAVFVAPFHQSSQRPKVQQFISRFRQAFQREPDLLAAQAYDAAHLAIDAIAGGGSGLDVARRLEVAPPLDGVTGVLDATQGGEIQRRMAVLRISRGQVSEVMWGGAATGFIGNEQAERTQPNKIF